MKPGVKQLNPYLNFASNTEEAFTFYKSVFGGEFLGLMRFKDFSGNPMDVPEEDLNKIAHIALPLGEGTIPMGMDALASLGKSLTFGNNFYISLDVQGIKEAEGLFGALSEGGQVEMRSSRPSGPRSTVCVRISSVFSGWSAIPGT